MLLVAIIILLRMVVRVMMVLVPVLVGSLRLVCVVGLN